MDLVFIDGGLISEGEHSYALLERVRAAAARRGLRSRIFGAKILTPAVAAKIGATAHFNRTLYNWEPPTPGEIRLRSLEALFFRAPQPDPTASERATFKALNECFEKDLEALPPDVWSSGNLIVVPAITQNQILGLVRFLLARPRDGRPPVVCQLMFPPNWLPWGRNAAWGARHYRKAFRLAAPLIGKILFFTTENEAIAALYRERFGIETKILPTPLGGAPEIKSGNARPRLGFFGYSKCEKGFHLLPRAIAFCRKNGLDAEFSIQIQHGGWEPAAVAAERGLRAIDGVRLVEGVLDSDDYLVEISKIDVMLLPYDPSRFGLRGSGVFTESVAAGRPVVASAGTFAASRIERGEASGEVFAPYESEALAEAILRLAPRLDQYKARAATLAAPFAKAHSAETYVDVLLSHVAR